MQQIALDFYNTPAEIVADRADDTLKLRLGEFAGPLDLLLHLIRQEQVNIYDIPMARITDEYLRVVRQMRSLDIAVAGDFLVMAATLIEIKSRMLLPHDPRDVSETIEEDDDPRRELIERLLEHQRYKQAAEILHERGTIEAARFIRGRIETDDANPETNVTAFDLLGVFQKILARHKEETPLDLAREEFTLAQILERLTDQLKQNSPLDLTAFFEQARTRRELVLTLLAALELVRAGRARLTQNHTFATVLLQKAD